jgi:hypothetical protein
VLRAGRFADEMIDDHANLTRIQRKNCAYLAVLEWLLGSQLIGSELKRNEEGG